MRIALPTEAMRRWVMDRAGILDWAEFHEHNDLKATGRRVRVFPDGHYDLTVELT